MNDAPACVDARVREQPLDGTHPAPRVAVVDFARLLRRVDVDRRARRRHRHDLRQLLARDGAKTVGRHTHRVMLGLTPAHHGVEQFLERVDAVQESPLARSGGRTVEIAVRVEDGKQRQPKARRACSADDAPRELGGIRIRFAARVMSGELYHVKCGKTDALSGVWLTNELSRYRKESARAQAAR